MRGDALAQGGLRRPARAQRRGDRAVDGCGQHRPGVAVAGRLLGQRAGQLDERHLMGAVHRRDPELLADVHQDLVAPAGRAVDQRLDRVVLELVDAHADPQCQQRGDGGGVGDGEVGDACGRGHGRCGPRGGLGDDGDTRLGLVRLRHLQLHLQHRRRVLGRVEDAVGVHLHVEHLRSGTAMGRQGQGALREVGQRRRPAHPDLDDPLHPEPAELDRGAHQLEGLDPTHRGGELPGRAAR